VLYFEERYNLTRDYMKGNHPLIFHEVYDCRQW